MYIKLGRTFKIAGKHKEALYALNKGIDIIRKIDHSNEHKKLIIEACCWIIRTKISDGNYD
jgi:hypothetical protein